ncbi:MAG TPA: diguanylate cyclase [Desulfobacteraceae bacterium]|nr:diguanylate cyclase [Desulfobacteraceae bacterium]
MYGCRTPLPGNEVVGVTISIRAASSGIDAKTFEGLFNSADKALYRAKAQGRNRVCNSW